jgi:hypothetical protein
MTDDIRKGDKVAHRENGKLGAVLEVLSEGHYWQADLKTATGFTAWAVVQWQREEKPAVESIADLIMQTQA